MFRELKPAFMLSHSWTNALDFTCKIKSSANYDVKKKTEFE